LHKAAHWRSGGHPKRSLGAAAAAGGHFCRLLCGCVWTLTHKFMGDQFMIWLTGSLGVCAITPLRSAITCKLRIRGVVNVLTTNRPTDRGSTQRRFESKICDRRDSSKGVYPSQRPTDRQHGKHFNIFRKRTL